ncbi:hypothetical protein [Aureimonas mangrovi]|nr:hypothetical protein [Aureimonas mangrovi]
MIATLDRWIRRQREENTLLFQLAMNDALYVALGIGVIVTGFFSGLYF